MTARRTPYVTLGLLALGLTAAIFGLHPSPVAAHRDPHDMRGPLDLREASMGQERARMRLAIRTRGEWSPRDLKAQPRIDRGYPENYLCLQLRQDHHQRRYCLTKSGSSRTRMVGGPVDRSGELRDVARVKKLSFRRPGRRSFVITFPFSSVGLRIGRFNWHVLSGSDDPTCAPESDPDPDPLPLPRTAQEGPGHERELGSLPCFDKAPNRGRYKNTVQRPRIVGCTRDEDLYNTNGSRSGKRIALTFDDGPSSYTGRVIDILNHENVNATFFLIGANIPGRTHLMRRMIASGHEIANHSLHHENGASAASLRKTSSLIRGATGFRPCLYRPPGGYRSADTAAAAWGMRMSNILWDVDPQDWRRSGSGAIYSRVVSATRPGSIVLLHDGGGDRSQTVAALDDIIAKLKSRGYRLVTVTRILKERFRWRP